MPDIALTDLDTRLSAMGVSELNARLSSIRLEAKGDFKNLSLEQLREVAMIAAKLRQQNSGPPKTPKSKSAKTPLSLDALDI